jgi:hypothetical protein
VHDEREQAPDKTKKEPVKITPTAG